MEIGNEGGGIETFGRAGGGGVDGAVVDREPEGEEGCEEEEVEGGERDGFVDGW